MINAQWLKLPMFRTNFHGSKDARATEAVLYIDEHKTTRSGYADVQFDVCLYHSQRITTNVIF